MQALGVGNTQRVCVVSEEETALQQSKQDVGKAGMRSMVMDIQLIATSGLEDPVSILAVPVTMVSQQTFLLPSVSSSAKWTQ